MKTNPFVTALIWLAIAIAVVFYALMWILAPGLALSITIIIIGAALIYKANL